MNIDLSKYGITGATEIIYNPSYEDVVVVVGGYFKYTVRIEGYRILERL